MLRFPGFPLFVRTLFYFVAHLQDEKSNCRKEKKIIVVKERRVGHLQSAGPTFWRHVA
jgi:hypothetical protein